MALDIPDQRAVRVELMRAAHESAYSNSKIDIELATSSTGDNYSADPVLEAQEAAARATARADQLEEQAARLLGDPVTEVEIIAALDERYSK